MRAQSITVPPNLNGTPDFPLTWLSDFIDADTLQGKIQKNKEYLLEPGGAYAFTGQAIWTSDVVIKSKGKATDPKPVIFRLNKTGATTLPNLYNGFGSLRLENLYIIMGDNGPTASAYQTIPLQGNGKGKTYHVKDCVILKSRQAVWRIQADSSKCIVEGSHIYNIGDYGQLQGNGRVIDPRNSNMDSVIIRNNVVHNMLDRIFIGFRQTGLKYLSITNNTIFNHVGRHGFIQVGKNTKETLIRDNIFINPSIMGTNRFVADEQFAPHVRQENFLFTLDTLNPGAKITMTNNNLFYTPDVLNHYATFDSVSKPNIFSPAFAKLINPSTATFSEPFELINVPGREQLIKYSFEALKFRDSTGITRMMVEDIGLKGTEYDRGYLFDFSKFNACYATSSKSFTGASDGKALGARWACGLVLSAKREQFNPNITVEATPNPVIDRTKIAFTNPSSGNVRIKLVDNQGRFISVISEKDMPEGQNEILWEKPTSVTAGTYFVTVETDNGKMFTRILIQ
jgi:hypothetical protein